MRFQLKLKAIHERKLLSFNYQYLLSPAIHKIIERADKNFSVFLHDKGYGEGHTSFKLFTFSDIPSPNGDGVRRGGINKT